MKEKGIIEPIKKSRLSAEIQQKIQSLIIDGTYLPGERLPSERELADQFQVSRASVREALRILENLGYLEVRVGITGGTFVRQITIDNVLDPFTEILGNEEDLVLEMIEFRKILETEYARIAAGTRTEDDLLRMQGSLDLETREIEDGDLGLQGDRAFHEAVARATQNSVFEKMLAMAKGLLEKTRETTLKTPGQPLRGLADHKKIYAAIANGDGDQAAALMMDHLQKAYENAAKYRGTL